MLTAGRSPRGSVDRNLVGALVGVVIVGSLPSRERGSKHEIMACGTALVGRSPRGSVDRNIIVAFPSYDAERVAPLAGAWIETTM